jgi:hypothetical protein
VPTGSLGWWKRLGRDKKTKPLFECHDFIFLLLGGGRKKKGTEREDGLGNGLEAQKAGRME